MRLYIKFSLRALGPSMGSFCNWCCGILTLNQCLLNSLLLLYGFNSSSIWLSSQDWRIYHLSVLVKFAWVCIKIDLSKPLKRGLWIINKEQRVFVVVLYENFLCSVTCVGWLDICWMLTACENWTTRLTFSVPSYWSCWSEKVGGQVRSVPIRSTSPKRRMLHPMSWAVRERVIRWFNGYLRDGFWVVDGCWLHGGAAALEVVVASGAKHHVNYAWLAVSLLLKFSIR